MTASNIDDTASRVRTILHRLSPFEGREIGADDRLVEDLGLNSIALVELSVTLEHEFDFTFAADQAAEIITVGELESFVADGRETR
jgi:acyl carrier protein